MAVKSRVNKNYIIYFLILLIVEILIALYVHDDFIRPYVGDTLVIVLIYFLLRIFMSKGNILPLGIFGFAVLVELLQIINIPLFLGLQDNTIITTIFGSYFDWRDIVCYFVGTAVIYMWQALVRN